MNNPVVCPLDVSDRLKVFYVKEQDLLCLAVKQSSLDQVVIPVIEGIPADAVVCRVWHEPLRRRFAFVVQHESFPPVGEFDAIPDASPNTMYIRQITMHSIDRFCANLDQMTEEELLQLKDLVNTRIYDLQSLTTHQR